MNSGRLREHTIADALNKAAVADVEHANGRSGCPRADVKQAIVNEQSSRPHQSTTRDGANQCALVAIAAPH